MPPPAPSARIRVGVIGCGRIAREHDLPGVVRSGLAEVVALCDVDSRRLEQGRHLAQELAAAAGIGPAAPPATFGDYRDLLAQRSVDAVVISTPDHGHACQAQDALAAGKDIYLQKPMTMTLAEGIRLRDAAAGKGRVIQIGSQQRSMRQFRRACELVRSGRAGRLARIEIGLPADPTAPDAPEEPIPANLDYDAWLGPAEQAYYTEQRVHPQEGYGRPGWLRNEAFCLGMITGWGSHHFDIAHWGMGVELLGPTRIEGTAEFPRNRVWNVHGSFTVELDYPGGVKVAVSDRFPNGVKFIGDAGWIFVTRDAPTTASDPFRRTGGLRSLDASSPGLLDPADLSVRFPASDDHHRNWLEAVASRGTPLSPPPVAHRSNSACILSWIAMKLQRPLTWDPAAERFVGDPVAQALTTRAERPR